jgi:hypothetical protein
MPARLVTGSDPQSDETQGREEQTLGVAANQGSVPYVGDGGQLDTGQGGECPTPQL